MQTSVARFTCGKGLRNGPVSRRIGHAVREPELGSGNASEGKRLTRRRYPSRDDVITQERDVICSARIRTTQLDQSGREKTFRADSASRTGSRGAAYWLRVRTIWEPASLVCTRETSPVLDLYGRSWTRQDGSLSKQAANDVFGFAVEWLEARSWRRSFSSIPKLTVSLRILLAGFVIMRADGLTLVAAVASGTSATSGLLPFVSSKGAAGGPGSGTHHFSSRSARHHAFWRGGRRSPRLGAVTMLVNFYGPRVPFSRGIAVGRHPYPRSGRRSLALDGWREEQPRTCIDYSMSLAL